MDQAAKKLSKQSNFSRQLASFMLQTKYDELLDKLRYMRRQQQTQITTYEKKRLPFEEQKKQIAVWLSHSEKLHIALQKEMTLLQRGTIQREFFDTMMCSAYGVALGGLVSFIDQFSRRSFGVIVNPATLNLRTPALASIACPIPLTLATIAFFLRTTAVELQTQKENRERLTKQIIEHLSNKDTILSTQKEKEKEKQNQTATLGLLPIEVERMKYAMDSIPSAEANSTTTTTTTMVSSTSASSNSNSTSLSLSSSSSSSPN
eukprot:TRINITY_DN1650_c0_g1_i1.p1 TRINITY_DN1650_c0_g1~~TRINITY_DN1650_c0_g1_i1.p1  ORF type:complete len:276 (-),score=85.81 TRINITY_DN1650_c0_g1_i1:273-1058(-)